MSGAINCSEVLKFNPYHDERGRFTTGHLTATAAGEVPRYGHPRTVEEAKAKITAMTDVKDVYVDDHPNALRASTVVADTMNEMRNKGYKMPNLIMVTTGHRDVNGETLMAQPEGHPVESIITIEVPEKAPVDAPLDSLVALAFGGKTKSSELYGQPPIDRFVPRTMKEVVVHEMGHLQFGIGDTERLMRIQSKWQEFYGKEAGSRRIKMATEQISAYASKTHHEFVAETFTKMYRGDYLPQEARELYAELGGPKLL